MEGGKVVGEEGLLELPLQAKRAVRRTFSHQVSVSSKTEVEM